MSTGVRDVTAFLISWLRMRKSSRRANVILTRYACGGNQATKTSQYKIVKLNRAHTGTYPGLKNSSTCRSVSGGPYIKMEYMYSPTNNTTVKQLMMDVVIARLCINCRLLFGGAFCLHFPQTSSPCSLLGDRSCSITVPRADWSVQVWLTTFNISTVPNVSPTYTKHSLTRSTSFTIRIVPQYSIHSQLYMAFPVGIYMRPVILSSKVQGWRAADTLLNGNMVSVVLAVTCTSKSCYYLIYIYIISVECFMFISMVSLNQ